MGGSLRNPASFCNVVGFRPSPGRVPMYPVPTAWSTMVVQGPMARNVSDVALMLSVMAGPDPRSPIALQDPGVEFDVPLERDLRGLRVAWSPDLGGAVTVDTAVTAALMPALNVFRDLGCSVERACPDFTGADEVFRALRAWQFVHGFDGLIGACPDQVKATIIANADEGRRLTGLDIARAEQLHTELFHRVRVFFENYDILLLPVSQVPPFPANLEFPDEIAGVRHDNYLDWMRSSYLVTATGCPALSVPAGFTPDGLPVGLQVVGPHRQDLAVLQVGHSFEQATRIATRRPSIASTQGAST